MAETKKTPTIDELIELPEPMDAQIAPDGRHVAYVVRTVDWKKNEYIAQIWLTDTDTDTPPRQLTFAKTSSSTPRWSPDGQWLAFVAKRNDDKQPQLYRMSPFGGEAERLTELETAVQQPAWSPGGNAIAFITPDADSDADKKRKETYGDYHIEDVDHQWSHLWLVDVASKKCRKLSGGRAFHVYDFHWSPDSQTIAFTGAPTPDIADWENSRIYTLTLATLTAAHLSPPGYLEPHWSPDGAQLVCTQFGDAYYRNKRPYLLHPTSGQLTPILTDFDENVTLQGWGPDGIYFAAIQRTTAHIFRLDPHSGQARQITPTNEGSWATFSATFSSDYAQAAMIAADAAHFSELVHLRLADGSWQRLTQLGEPVQAWNLSQPETITWRSHDGTEIEGVLSKPANFNPAQRYPLLVVIHGGPSWASFQTLLSSYERRAYPLPLWLAQDALILQPNYRGSTGYGEAFRALNVRNLGVGDYEDVISGVDALIAKGWVDPDRVGAMGWSQGGYISMFITTYSDRFKAVSAGAGISNWMTYYVNTDIHPFTRHYLQATPWEDDNIYKRTSPMTYIKQAKTPTLIQHGGSDARVPPPNAYELYQGLRDVGVEVKLVTYPGMPHGPVKPRQCRSLMQDNLDWFNRWLWGKEAEAKRKRQCYVALASDEQKMDEGELVAVERYTAVPIQDTYHWSRRDDADFRILSATHGLLAADDVTPPDPRPALNADDVPALAAQLAEQFSQHGWQEVVLYTGKVAERPSPLIALGCLHVAAGLTGKVTVKHQEMTENGWNGKQQSVISG